MAYLVAVYINKTNPLSPKMQLAVSLPLSLTNTLFFFWIMSSLERTKKTLEETRQNVKLRVMQRFTHILLGVYAVAVLAVFGEIWVKFSGERDTRWRIEWLVESSWFLIFSVFVFAVMVLMRPTDTSKLLAYVEELHETDQGAQPDSARKKEEGSVEMAELPPRKQERAKLDANAMKSDDFVVVIENGESL